MPSQYCEITLEEMRDHLQVEKGWYLMDELGTREYVFIFPLKSKPGIVIKVFSSIRKGKDVGRDCGQDAIRVCAVDILNDRGWIKARRVYRVQNWRENLRVAVLDVLDRAKRRIA